MSSRGICFRISLYGQLKELNSSWTDSYRDWVNINSTNGVKCGGRNYGPNPVDLTLLDLALYFIDFLEVSLIPYITATASLPYVDLDSMLLFSINSFFSWVRLRYQSSSILNKILIMEQHGAAMNLLTILKPKLLIMSLL